MTDLLTQLRDYGRQIESDPILHTPTRPEEDVLTVPKVTRRTSGSWVWGPVAAAVVLLAFLPLILGSSVDEPAATTVAPDVETLISPRLAYEVDGDVYLADWDGGNAVLVADGVSTQDGCGGFTVEEGLWAPDGLHFAYRSWWSDTCPGEVHVSDAQGRLVTSVPGVGWHVAWSPDSTLFATWVELSKTIGIYTLDGDRQALLTLKSDCGLEGDFDPVWSADGESVIFGYCQVPIDGGTPTRLPLKAGRRAAGWGAQWSPDGTQIAYMSSSGDCDTFDSSLEIAEADGTVLQVVDEEPTPSPWYDHLLWSPSGDRVLFQWTPRTRDCGFLYAASELRQIDVVSGQVTTIAAIPGVRPIRVSPDGDRILFSAQDGEKPTGLWSIDADGSNTQLLVPNAEGDWEQHHGGD